MAFIEAIVAPCGVNCGVCIGYQREKNKCCGCLVPGINKLAHCSKCLIKFCAEHQKAQFTYCYECPKFPCARLKRLSKRYTEKYHCNLIANLQRIAQGGLEDFLKAEDERWKCRQCGEILSVHRNTCQSCGSVRHDLEEAPQPEAR